MQYPEQNEVEYYPDQAYAVQGHHPGEQIFGQEYGGDPQMDGVYDGHYADEAAAGDYTEIPEVMVLNHYCASAQGPRDSTEQALEEASLSWEPVREWLHAHHMNMDMVREAAQQRGHHAMTALHWACRHVPPPDIIELLLTVAGDTAEWQDSVGCLPIHYACAFSAEFQVIKRLADTFPESKTVVDIHGKTPLHYAMNAANSQLPAWAAVVVLLSSSGAARVADNGGMLPLHHACAFGTSEEALYVLTNSYGQGIMTRDYEGRTPLIFALSNAGRKASPVAVRLLLSLNKDMVNATGGGQSPVKVLAQFAQKRTLEPAERESVLKCLEHLLSFNPNPTADFFTALQSLPEWLKERAVVMKNVQTLLNIKIAQRFPTGILLSDLFVQLLVLVFYFYSIDKAVQHHCGPLEVTVDAASVAPTTLAVYNEGVETSFLVPLYLGGTYFFVRVLTQILSLLALGAFRVWFENPSNWLDVIYVFLVLYWSIVIHMDSGPGEVDMTCDAFRTGAALSIVVLWMKFLAYLRNTYIDFAVFLGGLFYVVRRLVAFLLCLCIILVAFSQMFYTYYFRDGDQCEGLPDKESIIKQIQAGDQTIVKPYCERWTAFLHTFTMLLGEVNENDFDGENNGIPLVLFVLFVFLVVILLANVLIAIVADSYKVIQDQRAAIVFWSNRLVFVAQADSVANGPWKKHIRDLFGLPAASNSENAEVTFGRDLWHQLMDLFHDDIDYGTFSFDFFVATLRRIFAAFVIIPVWIIFGLMTFGSLWPPQIREYVFTSKVLKHSSKADEDDELRKRQTRILQEEVQTLRDDLLQDLAMDRTQVVQMKSLVAERKQLIQGEMKHIKQLVTMLFEQQAGM